MKVSHGQISLFKSTAACVVILAAILFLNASTISAQTVLAAASANLDQCRNGGVGQLVQQCIGDGAGASGWVNGNAGPENAHWAENQFITYRMRFQDLTLGTHTVIIGYDILQQTKHAIDYLGTYNATATDAMPCDTVPGCGGTPSTFAIPEDTFTVTSQINPNNGLPISQIPGVFTMWGGTITAVSYVPYAGGDERQIQVTFTANVSNPVLAWGGHIAWIGDWGQGNSASAINGSPYHMRLIDLDGSGGNQDRSLKNGAVTASGAVVIKKEVSTVDGSNAANTSFGFTATPNFGYTTFSLIDNNMPGIDTKIGQAITSFGSGNQIVVTENSIANWSLAGITCTPSAGQTVDIITRTATIVPQAATVITCTFMNTQFAITAAPADVDGRVTTSAGSGIRGAYLTLTDLSTGEVRTVVTNNFGYYRFTGMMTDDVYNLTVSAKRYTFATNSQTFTLRDSLSGVNFTASSPAAILPPTSGAAILRPILRKQDSIVKEQ